MFVITSPLEPLVIAQIPAVLYQFNVDYSYKMVGVPV